MEETTGQHGGGGDRITRGGRLVRDNFIVQPLQPRDERIVSPNPSLDATMSGSLRTATSQPEALRASGVANPVYPLSTYSLPEQSYLYGSYDGTGTWGDYSNYAQASGLQIVPPAVSNDSNQSVLFHPVYGFDTQMTFSQFSPMASPVSPIIIDGQLYSPSPVPFSPSFYPQAVSTSLPHVSSTLPVSQTERMTPATSGHEDLYYSQGSGYYLPYGSFSGGNPSGNNSLGYYNFPGDIGSGESLSNRSNSLDTSTYWSPTTPGAVYPLPVGMLGSYEYSYEQAPFHGYGSASSSSTRRYPQSGSYRSSYHDTGSFFNGETNRMNRHSADKGGKRYKDRDSVSISSDSHGIVSDRNRGPRASRPKDNNTTQGSSRSKIGKDSEGTSRAHLDLYNRPDFVTKYEKAKFFVIKSFSEDNVHKSIKYNVWASTPLGNRKLDAAYREAKEAGGPCPVFLFFSVNASGQFYGVAEMVGPVDFENDAEYWQQDRWSGQFPVKWHIIKDVPNSEFRHILLENNENKPVTHSRDSQEVKLEEGLEMLKIFKEHELETSILDDFRYYDEREKDVQGMRSRDRDSGPKNASVAENDTSVAQISEKISESLKLEDSKEVHETA